MSTIFATALVASSDSGGGSGLLSLGILLLIPFAMYFLMIRPQRKRAKDQQALQGSLAVGDDVITTSGIYGQITGEDGPNRFWVEIDDDVQIRVARAAIQGKTSEGGDDDDEADAPDEANVDADANADADD